LHHNSLNWYCVLHPLDPPKRRKELADKAGLLPYVIFPDKTLIEMAAFSPRSEESRLRIHGIGSVKYKKYGTIFLDIVEQYCREHHIE
jgi:ATP-dependent DNA helicase RecQ